MLRHRDVFVLLLFVGACAVGARAQVLSYSTYTPTNKGTRVSIAVNGAGETCAGFITAVPLTVSTVSGAKFRSDGSRVYSISTLPGPTLVEAIDATGNCYFAGQGQTTPTPGAFQSMPKSSPSMYVEKFDPSGNLAFATYLGGSGSETPAGIAVDSSGNVYVTGSTNSNDFPTLNAHQSTLATAPDIFVSVLNSTGAGLIYSTYWGGNDADSSAAIAVDPAHNAYITGLTSSTDFPIVSPFQSTPGGAFVIKLSSTGTPVYSTYLGPRNGFPPVQTFGSAIAADSSGSAYVVGGAGLGFPLKNPIGAPPSGGSGFVTKFLADGSALDYSTYFFGGALSAIVVDQSGQAYITGVGSNTGEDINARIPLVSPIQGSTLDGGFSSIFVSVLNSSGSGLAFSTFLGQGGFSTSIGIDATPNVYVSGTTGAGSTSSDGLFPILNASNGTYFAFDVDGTGVPQGFLSKISFAGGISLSHPDTVDFRQEILVAGLQSGFGEVLVGNTSAVGDISINSIAISEGDFSQTNNCPPVLVAAATCLVNVTFAPTQGGVRTGTITISDSAPGSPHVVNLTGTGLAPAAVVSPTTLTFAGQAVGTSSVAQQVTLTNSGTAALNITHIALTGDFSETNNCGTGLGAGSCQISVVFSPTASGNRTGVLTISFGTTGAPQTVDLSGQGVDSSPGLTVPQGGSSTAVVAAGASASYTLSIGGAGMSGMASLTCTGAPPGAVCTVPNTLTVDGNTATHFNVNVSTTSRAMAALGGTRSGWLWAVAIFGFAVLPWSQLTRKTANRYLPLAMVVALLLPSCGGGSRSGPHPNPNGTPAGTYTLTVGATVGSNVQSTSLTLTVQ
jgi:hypothetical protein